jgi:nitrogen fixation protein FixH
MSVLDRLRAGDRWIPWAFLAGFLVVLAANATLVIVALGSWTGLTTERAYAQGVNYNRTLAAARAQEALGWQADLRVEAPDPRLAEIRFSLTDRDGRPVQVDLVRARFVRPTQSGQDVEITLETRGGTDYRGEAALPLLGLWDLHVLAVKGEARFQTTERVVLK